MRDGSVVAFSFPIIASTAAVAFVLVVIAWKKSCPDSFVVVVVVIVGVFFSSNAKSSFVRSFIRRLRPFRVDGFKFPSNAVLNFGA